MIINSAENSRAGGNKQVQKDRIMDYKSNRTDGDKYFLQKEYVAVDGLKRRAKQDKKRGDD